ncbi:MAG TPA: ASKHA domain-containing protein [Thermoplasmata archaeon]
MAEQLVHFQPLGRKTEVRKGKSLLEHAHDAGVSIESICGSAGKCGKCKVVVRTGASSLSPPTDSETKLLSSDALRSGVRLACQALIQTPSRIVLEVPEESRRGHHRLLASGVEPEVKLQPAVRKSLLKIPPATLKDLRADDDRLIDVLFKRARIRASIHPGVHGSLPDAIRRKEWTATVTTFRDTEIIQVEPGDTTDEVFGVAVDIGTTKVVAYLIDLRTGETLANESMPNPQIPFGEDLMSRISYTIKEPEGGKRLQSVIVDGLNTLIRRLCEQNRLQPEDILEVMVVGNTAMHHLFFGIPAQHVAAAPYAPVVRTSLAVSPSHLGVDIYPFGRVSSLPNVAGFVGADAVADLVSSSLFKDRKIGMMIDIGTNTEIIAGNNERLISCSCASGPAFEGAHIKFGMRASTGAIERVWIDPSGGEVLLRTVDDAQPRGICGSGIVDAISEMFKAGMLDASGRLAPAKGTDRIRKSETGGNEFVLARANETAMGEEITITQHDIQEIQLAKAAIFTGVAVLMKRLKLRCSDLSKVYAAGAFGTYVDASSAINIGMYPDVPVDRIKFIGNAAGSGARMCLKSTKMRDLADDLSRKVKYVELAAEPSFQNEFAQAMFLPHRDLSRFPNHGRASSGRKS